MKQFREYEEAFGLAEVKRQAEEAWRKDLRAEFPHVPDEIFELCYLRAWERAQDKGHDAVYYDLIYVLEFAEAIIAADKRSQWQQ